MSHISPPREGHLCPTLPRAMAFAGSPDAVVRGACAALQGGDLGLILVFTPQGAGVAPLGAGLGQAFGEAVVLVCSSAGGFAYGGYDDDRTIIIAFPRAHFQAQAVWLDHLDQTPVMEWMGALRGVEQMPIDPRFTHQFGILLIDGASGQEELVTATCDAVSPQLMVVGGSAADGLRFGQTHLAIGGEERTRAAIFCKIATDFSIEEVILDHFTPEGRKSVVTESDPEARLILELNAEPAAAEYAALIGVGVEELTPAIFAAHPLIETQGGRHFVRAIRGVTAQGALSMMASVDQGAILGIGRAESLAQRLEARLGGMAPADLILGFDCILRRLAVEQAGEGARVQTLYADHRVAGFATYGEQHGGFHVNQTFVGLAFRAPRGHPALAKGGVAHVKG